MSEENMLLMSLPKYYANGFVILEDNIELEYLTDNEYNFESVKSIIWDELGIDCTLGGGLSIREDILSEKKGNARSLYER